MAKKITPSQVASQCGWGSPDLMEFCADVFEDANFHNICLSMSALAAGAYEVASDAILLERDQVKAGCLTGELQDRRADLYKRLKEAQAANKKAQTPTPR